MAKLKKSELAAFNNKEMAKALDLSEKKLKTAFKNYNKLLDYIDSGAEAASDKMNVFLELTETPEKKILA